MRCSVLAFALLLTAGFVPAKELCRVPALSAAAAVGPVSSPDTDPRILAIRDQENKALARDDRAELKRLEGEVQTILLSRQPKPARPGLKVGVVMPEPNLPALPNPDALIDTGYFFATAADYMMDGTMYATAFRTSDTVNWIYRSTDHGTTWQALIGYILSSGNRLQTRRIGLCVGEGDSAFLYVFVCLEPPYDNLYLMKANLDGSDMRLIPVQAGPDTVSDFAVCRDYSGSNYWLYAVAVNDQRVGAHNAFYLRSNDYGMNWAVTDTGGFDLHPHYSFGAGSWLYHALEGPEGYGSGQVWLFYNPSYGSPGQWQVQVLQPDTFPVADPVIAPAFTLPEDSAVVWSLFSHNFQGENDWDIISAWSTDGGGTWDHWNYLSDYSGVQERFPDVRNYTSPGNTYINGSYIHEATTRTVFRRYAYNGDPGDWSDTLRINTNSAGTGRTVRPLLIYSPGGPGSGSGCVFVGPGLRNLYFNSPWLTAVAESRAQARRASDFSVLPSVARGPVRVSWSGGATRLTVTDVAGRIVRSIAAPAGSSFVWDDKVPAGTYLVCLTTIRGTATRPVVIP